MNPAGRRAVRPAAELSGVAMATGGEGGTRRRASAALRMQQEALVQLVVGGVLVLGLAVAAAFVAVIGLGPTSIRSVPPLLNAFMEAGQSGDVLGGHRLFSERGLRANNPGEVARLFERRNLFEGYRSVRVDRFDVQEPESPSMPETAIVVATVTYDQGPPARIDARLDMEPLGWRIGSIRIARSAP